MKKIFCVFCFLCFSIVFSQKTEVRVCLNSNLFSFNGENAVKDSNINFTYTNNPFGSKNGFGYGISFDLRRITKQNTIYGLDIGFEKLKSKVDLESISVINGTTIITKKVDGTTNLVHNSLNFNPYVGHRFIINKLPVDLVGGVDFGAILNLKEKSSAKDENGVAYTIDKPKDYIKLDLRLRAQVATEYKRYGVYFGYSAGTVNYMANYDGSDGGVYSGIIRFGLTYRISR